MKSKQPSRVTTSKAHSRAMFGTVQSSKVIPNKRKKKPKYPDKED